MGPCGLGNSEITWLVMAYMAPFGPVVCGAAWTAHCEWGQKRLQGWFSCGCSGGKALSAVVLSLSFLTPGSKRRLHINISLHMAPAKEKYSILFSVCLLVGVFSYSASKMVVSSLWKFCSSYETFLCEEKIFFHERKTSLWFKLEMRMYSDHS